MSSRLQQARDRIRRRLHALNRRRARQGLMRRWVPWVRPEVIRLAALNLPHHAGKRRLAIPRLRAPHAVRALNQQDRSVVILSELSTLARLHFQVRRGWRLVCARPNNVLRGGRLWLGNGIAYSRHLYRLTHVWHHHVPMRGRRRGLNFVEVELQVIATGQRFRVLGIHAPRKKLDPGTNAAVLRLAIRRLRAWHHAGIPGAAGGDTNNGALIRRLVARARGIATAVQHGVDVLILTGMDEVQDGTTHGDYSDHHMVMADARVTA